MDILDFLGVFNRFSINIRGMKYTDFWLHREMKRHWSRVNLLEAHKIYTWPVSFHFPMQKKCISILKNNKKDSTIHDMCEIKGFLIKKNLVVI